MFERIKVADTPLAHSQNCVKQIIEKPMEARKIYAPRSAKNAAAIIDTNRFLEEAPGMRAPIPAARESLRR
jgi:hypothetical protein